MKFLAFLIVSFSVSNAALLPANYLDNSEPLLDPPLPGSLSLNQPAPGNDPNPFSLHLNAFDSNNNPTSSSPLLDPQLPGSLSLNQPAPGNNPSPFSLDLNAFDSANKPTSSYSLELAKKPNENGAGEGASITYAETQAQTDDSSQICGLDRITGQKRRKRESSYCPAPLELQPKTPTKSPEGSTPEERRRDKVTENDREWLGAWTIDRLKRRFGSNWAEELTEEELWDAVKSLTMGEKSECERQSQRMSTYLREIPLCCVGPSQTLPRSLQIGLAPRQQPEESEINWFNCQTLITGRPFCTDMGTTDVCCHTAYDKPNPSNQEPPRWWRWGFKGVDCITLAAGA